MRDQKSIANTAANFRVSPSLGETYTPLRMKPSSPLPNAVADIVSEPLVYPSRSGLKMSAFWDHRAVGHDGCPFVVMGPKFGETKKGNLELAYSLAANGLNVLRFDHTCHVGESDGNRLDFTLQTAVEDILATLDYLRKHHGVASAGVIGNSLSARTALRAAALDARVSFFISVVGVVNFRRTIVAVNGEDTLGAYLDGRKRGVDDVLGFEVDFERFLEAVFANNLQGLDGTIEDARRLKVPAVFFAAGDDVWVELDDVRAVAAALPGARLHVTEGVMHDVRENPEAGAQLFREIVATAVQLAYGSRERPATLRAVPKTEVLKQNRIERNRLRQAVAVERDETVFWSQYLRKFDYIQNGEVYRRYLDLVIDLLGDIPAGGIVLDAGCGNGFAGIAYDKHALARGPLPGGPPVWVSVDLTSSGLNEAMRHHLGNVEVALGAAPSAAASTSLDFGYAVGNLDLEARPAGGGIDWLADATLSGVVASLLISYLKDPAPLLKELHRVLKPGGRLVVSSLKPNCDLSLIYRTFIEQVQNPDELEPARDLLRAAGAIRIKEDLGYYRFFSGEDLVELLSAAGFRHCLPFMTLANQAVVARAEK